MQRINVIGSSGSGKTTLAARLAERLGLEHLELDSLHHQENWTPIDTDEFRRQVSDFAAQDRWVIDGNYTKVREAIWPRADTVVFLDLPRWRVIPRLAARTARRVITRQELWNGNRETVSDVLSRDPERNVVVWSWTRHTLQRERYTAAVADPAWSHIDFIRLETPREVTEFVRSLNE